MNGWSRSCCYLAGLAWALLAVASAAAQDGQWIWSPEHAPDNVPTGESCHFRKVFTLRAPEAGQIAIAADDAYDLFVNGRKVASGGANNRKLVEHDVTRFLTRGQNVVGVKVTNRTGKTAALVARVTIKERGGNWQSHSTDSSWKTALSPLPLWNTALYNDRSWDAAQAFGDLNAAPPASDPATASVGDEPPPAEETAASASRFTIDDQFQVQLVLSGEETGSLTAMTFNEFGHILAAKEGGGLLLIYDGNNDKIPEKVRTYCDKVQNIQGILALNGEVYVTGGRPRRARPLPPGRQGPRRRAGRRPHARPLRVRSARARRPRPGARPRRADLRAAGQPCQGRAASSTRPARTATTTKGTCSRRATKIRAAMPSASRPRAARSFAPTPTAAACSSWPAACGIPMTWRSTAKGTCSSTMPTWSRTKG